MCRAKEGERAEVEPSVLSLTLMVSMVSKSSSRTATYTSPSPARYCPGTSSPRNTSSQ